MGRPVAGSPDVVALLRALVGERLPDRAHTALALSGKRASRWTDSREVPAMDVFGGYVS